MHFIGNLFDRILVVLFALLFLQMPLFMQQYSHQLAGHVAELSDQLLQMEKNAARSGKSVKQWVEKFKSHQDQEIALQGETMQRTLSRYQTFSSSLSSLTAATALTRPFVFLRHLDPGIAASTFDHFQPGLTFSYEACLYALGGVLLATGVCSLIRGLFRRFQFLKN